RQAMQDCWAVMRSRFDSVKTGLGTTDLGTISSLNSEIAGLESSLSSLIQSEIAITLPLPQDLDNVAKAVSTILQMLAMYGAAAKSILQRMAEFQKTLNKVNALYVRDMTSGISKPPI